MAPGGLAVLERPPARTRSGRAGASLTEAGGGTGWLFILQGDAGRTLTESHLAAITGDGGAVHAPTRRGAAGRSGLVLARRKRPRGANPRTTESFFTSNVRREGASGCGGKGQANKVGNQFGRRSESRQKTVRTPSRGGPPPARAKLERPRCRGLLRAIAVRNKPHHSDPCPVRAGAQRKPQHQNKTVIDQAGPTARGYSAQERPEMGPLRGKWWIFGRQEQLRHSSAS